MVVDYAPLVRFSRICKDVCAKAQNKCLVGYCRCVVFLYLN